MRIQLSQVPDSRSGRSTGGSGGIPDTIANATTDGNQVDRRMLIGGNLVESGSDRSSPVNPATGEVLGHAPDATVADALACRRRRASPRSTRHRLGHQHRVAGALPPAVATPPLVEHRGEMGQLTTDEVGATPALLARRPVRPAGRDRPLLRRTAETYPVTDDLSNIESRGMLHHRWVERKPPASSPRSSPATIEPAGPGQLAPAGRRLLVVSRPRPTRR